MPQDERGYLTLPHELDPGADCDGCLVVEEHGDTADLVCNSCGAVIDTVPIDRVGPRLMELASVDICSALSPPSKIPVALMVQIAYPAPTARSMMEYLGRRAFSFSLVLATILICPISLMASIVISVTSPPALSTGIGSPGEPVVSTSWSELQSYTDVTITALVDSFIVGQTPTATAYLTTQIGPGTTATDEIAHAEFMVPLCAPLAALAGRLSRCSQT